MKTIDLTEDFGGHVVLWAKNWYTGEGCKDRTLERLNEVMNEWAGITGVPLGTRDVLRVVMNTAKTLGVTNEDVVESLMLKAAVENKRYTSYHVQVTDQISIASLVEVYVSQIQSARTKDLVLLPKLLPGLKEKYNLKGREGVDYFTAKES